jgi:pimeloyl-ACP methyl ester carboxylesterase
MDLLTRAEEQVDLRTRQWRFDIPLLSTRVVGAVDALPGLPEAAGLPIATFGASTGAAAALRAAAARPEQVRAVVSRGGRPDLAGSDLRRVRAPTLMIVGGRDREVLALNRDAAAQLAGPCEISVVPGATHLFEEPGALDQVIALSVRWLLRWLSTDPGATAPT